MSELGDDDLWDKWQSDSMKFDYFVCGLIGAMIAYMIQAYSPKRLACGLSLLEPASLLLLAGAFFAGLKRIQTRISGLGVNHLILHSSAECRRITLLLKENRESYEQETGKVLSRQHLEEARRQQAEARTEAEMRLPHVNRKAEFWYNWRNIFLLLGFLCILGSKLSQPYESDVSHPSRASTPITNMPTQPKF
jgi:hypothetical protein